MQESQEATYDFPGGIPTSMKETQQQWDFPNAWPPTTEIVVTALRNAREEYPGCKLSALKCQTDNFEQLLMLTQKP